MKKGYNQNESVEYKNKNKKRTSHEKWGLPQLSLFNHYHILDLKLYQINIQIFFLNGELNKKIYIDQLTCFMATK